ncbi:Lrp/AsnC family transcriptional regulator [Candidatus Pacearchaeota archaeon]|nr:Lrp/AsnC family transcriptional regulator [Candidatus Pacearchaeota archaeon]
MVIKLDLKDRKILYELDFEARQSASQIGKKVGLPTEVVHYRIKQLEKKGIISNYMVMLDLAKLGIKQFKIYLKFENLTREAEDKIITYFKSLPVVKWIVSCFGIFDMIIAIETKTLEEFDKIKNEIISKLSDFIYKNEISQLIEAITYRRNYIVGKKGSLQDEANILGKQGEIDIDKIDLEILKKLARNGRASVIDIATKLKTTERIVSYRIKQLEKQGIILGTKIAINYEKLDYKFFKSFIKIKKPTSERIKEFMNYCKMHPNIIHFVRVLGEWDLEPEFEVSGNEEFFKILVEIRDNFSDIIKTIDTIIIIREHKFSYF